jgi:NTP pyrophosphatase (non-canonical NTP hydrolase)
MTEELIDFPLTQFRNVQRRCYETAKRHGWWEKYDCPEAELFKEEIMSSKLMLMVSELAETLEEIRKGKDPAEIYVGEGGKPEGIPVELADTIIRIFDLAERHEVDLAHAINIKMMFNENRPYKHGGKKL